MKMAKQEGYIHIPCNRMHNWRPPSLSELTPLLNIIGVNSLRPVGFYFSLHNLKNE